MRARTCLLTLGARRHGIHAGIDVATGGEGLAVYVQFGNAWFPP